MKKTILAKFAVLILIAGIILFIPGILFDVLLLISIIGSFLVLLFIICKKLSSISDNTKKLVPTLAISLFIFVLFLTIVSFRLILTQGTLSKSLMFKAFLLLITESVDIIHFTIFCLLFVIFIGITSVLIRMNFRSLSKNTKSFLDIIETKTNVDQWQKEAEFLGALDGARKFGQGNVKIIIGFSVITILCGIGIGIFIHNEPAIAVLKIYSSLALGNCLLLLLPVFFFSLVMRIITTKSILFISGKQ